MLPYVVRHRDNQMVILYRKTNESCNFCFARQYQTATSFRYVVIKEHSSFPKYIRGSLHSPNTILHFFSASLASTILVSLEIAKVFGYCSAQPITWPTFVLRFFIALVQFISLETAKYFYRSVIV